MDVEKFSKAPNFYSAALIVATIAHNDQKDKGGKHYIDHCIRVSMQCETDLQKVVALLHDVVEDTDVTLEDFDTIFEEVEVDAQDYEDMLEAVDALTHRKNEPLEEYWDRVKACPLALYVKERDINDNTSPNRVGHFSEEDRARILAKYARARKHLGITTDG